jgi:hypothetical protein
MVATFDLTFKLSDGQRYMVSTHVQHLEIPVWVCETLFRASAGPSGIFWASTYGTSKLVG